MAKPEVCRTQLPRLLARRLAPNGVTVVNVLPVSGVAWEALVAPLVAPYRARLLVTLEDYENKLALGAQRLGSAREVSLALRAALRSIGSKQARRISVASL
jgi:hypothetical protein